MPLISVIVPVYKVEPYLRECVDSILNQTFKDFELILVDDGSSDNCPAICDEYKDKDNRVMVIHKENGGLSSARNAGLDYVFANSNSEYISFIDSDDYVDIQYLEKLYHAISSNQYDISLCNIHIVDVNSKVTTTTSDLMEENCDSFTLLKRSMDIGFVYITAWGKLFKRSVLLLERFKVGKVHEDEFFSNTIYKKNLNAIVLNERLYKYRDNPAGISARIKLYKFDEFDAFFERGKIFKEETKYQNMCFDSCYHSLFTIYYSKDSYKHKRLRLLCRAIILLLYSSYKKEMIRMIIKLIIIRKYNEH